MIRRRLAVKREPRRLVLAQYRAKLKPASCHIRLEEGIPELKRALELDPLSLIINADLGEAYIWALGLAYELRGSYQQAIAAYQKAQSLDDDPLVLALLGRAYANSGNRDGALKILAQLKQTTSQRYVNPFVFGVVYSALSDKDKAFEWLERGYQDRVSDLAHLKVDPLVDNLRSDPRFDDLVRRVGLPQ